VTSRVARAGDGVTAKASARPSRPGSVPNQRKGYKLTLWVSTTSVDGLADVHGLLQLDGADPVPFCHLRDVQNPLAGALQEAYAAVERVRARPPGMSAPAGAPVADPIAQTTLADPDVPVTRSDAPDPPAPAAPAAQPSLF
jgi:hypothetical protein